MAASRRDAVEMADADLANALRDAATGHDAAVGELFRAIQPQLLRFLRHQAPEVAEDLASETWLQAAQRLPAFSGDISAFRALLFTIARRRVVDYYRARSRRPVTTPIPDRVEFSTGEGAESGVDATSAQDAVAELVKALPHDQAEVLLLRVLGDLDTEEIAHILGRTQGSVRVLQHRALKRLRAQLEKRTVMK